LELKNKYRKNFIELCDLLGQQQDVFALNILMSSPGTLLSTDNHTIKILDKSDDGLVSVLVSEGKKAVFKGNVMIKEPKRTRYISN
jgi:hypothetical protein